MRGARKVVFPAGRGADAETWLYRWLMVLAAVYCYAQLHQQTVARIWHAAGVVALILLASPLLFLFHSVRQRRVLRGVIGAACGWALAAILLPIIQLGHNAGHISTCGSQLKQITRAALAYADDHDGRVPPMSVDWVAAYDAYLTSPRIFHCPCADRPISYELNPFLRGRKLPELPLPVGEVVLLYETEGVGPSGRHDGYCMVAYADGRVKVRRADQLQNIWEPWCAEGEAER